MSLHTHRLKGIQKTRFLITGFLFLVALFGFINTSHAQVVEETIKSFHSNIELLESGLIEVTETIHYDFGTQSKRGIFREIPIGRVPGAIQNLKIDVESITDQQGNSLTYTIDSYDPIIIRIGNPSVYLKGEHQYIIQYTVENAVGSFKDFSEIYWNVTGSEWNVLIRKVSARIVIPKILSDSTLRLADYCGRSSSKNACSGEPVVEYLSESTVISFGLSEQIVLSESEGMTIAVGFPKGLIASDVSWWLVILTRVWFYPIPVIIALLWYRKRFTYMRLRRRFYKSNPIVVEYDAGNFDPLQTAAIIEGKIDNDTFSAQIIYLAIQGYIILEKDDSGDYTFTDTGKDRTKLSQYNVEIMEGIANKSEHDLVHSFYLVVNSVTAQVLDHLSKYGIRARRGVGDMSRFMKFFMGIFLAINPGAFIWVLAGKDIGLAFSISSVLIGVVALFVSRGYMLNNLGIKQQYKLRGLREYIDLAEQERIKFHNAPEKNPKTFEKLLPFAMVFRLEEKWADQFADMHMKPPDWYAGQSDAFSAAMYTKGMHDFTSHMKSSSAFSAPASSSSSSFSGGSSGGGSSGGGGGGGGGGSW